MFELFVLSIIFLVIALVVIRLATQPSSHSEYQQTHFPTAHTKAAQSEAALKDQIQNLPRVKVRYVIDGDTIIVTKGWSEIRIRLDSIDCPEDGQHWGDIAKYGLIKMIGSQWVYLEEHGIDKYGRTLATIYIRHKEKNEWMNVNERMVTLGHAWFMREFCDHLPQDRQNKLNRLEKWAQSKKIGLWSAPFPTPPWKWRREEGSSC